MQTLAERLKHIHGFIPDVAARKLDRLAGLSDGHTALIEAGRKPNIEAKTAEALARVLGVSLDWLILGHGNEPSQRTVRAAVNKAMMESDPS